VNALRRFFQDKVRLLPRQNRLLTRLSFAWREHYAQIGIIATLVITQLLGVVIFSQDVVAAGTITYQSKVETRANAYVWSFDEDADGNIYSTTSHGTNRKIRKYNSDGQFITEWGSVGTGDGQFGSSDIGPASVTVVGARVYAADPGNHRVQYFDLDGNYEGQFGAYGTGNGQFNTPFDVAVDSSGYIYVADRLNDRIQKFDSSFNYYDQWGAAGTGNGEFGTINSISISPTDEVYVSEGPGYGSEPRRVQKFDTEGNYERQFTDGFMLSPAGMDFDGLGNVYVGDHNQSRVWKYNSTGVLQQTWNTSVVGNGGVTHGALIDADDNIVLGDDEAGLGSPCQFLRKINQAGTTAQIFDNKCAGSLTRVSGVAVAADGSYYALARDGLMIHKYNASNVPTLTFGAHNAGSADGQFQYAQGITVSRQGSVYVADTYNSRIQKFTSDGSFVAKWGTLGSGNGQFQYPKAIATDSVGNVYVTDTDNNRIQKFTSDGSFVAKWGTLGSGDGQLNAPSGIAVDAVGNVYVADTGNDRIQKFASDGSFVAKWGTSGSGNGQFLAPRGLAVTPGGAVYVADYQRNDIQKFASDGTYISKVGSAGSGNGQFNFYNSVVGDYLPDLAINPTGANLYVADAANNRIQIFEDNSYDMRVTTLAASSVTKTSALVGVRSNDLPGYLGSPYSFDYGLTTSYGSSAAVGAMSIEPYSNTPVPSSSGWTGTLDGNARARDHQGNLYAVTTDCRVIKFDPDGNYLLQLGSVCAGNSTSAFSWFITSFAFDANNNVYIAQGTNSQYILKFDQDGNQLGYIDAGRQDMSDIDVDANNNLYVAMSGSDREVRKFNAAGTLVAEWGSNGSGDGQFNDAFYLDYDDITNTLFTIDNTNTVNARIQLFDEDGNFDSSWQPQDFSTGILVKDGVVVSTSLTTNIYSLDGTNLYVSVPPGVGVDSVDVANGTLSVHQSDYSITSYVRQGTIELSGLTCETTYHYRAKAVVASESTYGQDLTFETDSCVDPMEITTADLPDAPAGVSYDQAIETNSDAPEFSLASGELPPGLSLGTNGQITGTPTTLGTYTFTVEATDTSENNTGTDQQEFTIEVFSNSIAIETCRADFYLGNPVNYTIETLEGFGYPTFEIVSGSLPPGISMDGSGTITGTPTAIGVYDVRLRVTDLSGSDEEDCKMVTFKGSPNTNTPMITIDSPSANTTLQQDSLTVSGTGPVSSTIAIYVDNYQVATTTTDGAGNWSHQVENVFPGTHTLDAKWLPVGKVVAMATFRTLDSPYQTAINLVDTGLNKVVKRHFTLQNPSYGYGFAVSEKHSKAYMINTSIDQDTEQVTFGFAELDLATGQYSMRVPNTYLGQGVPAVIKMAQNQEKVYVLTVDEVITYTIATQQITRNAIPPDAFEGGIHFPFAALAPTADEQKLYAVYSHWDEENSSRKRRIAVIDLNDYSVDINDYGTDQLLTRGQSPLHHAHIIGSTLYATYADGVIMALNTADDTIVKTIDMNLENNGPSDYSLLYGASIDSNQMVMYATIVNQGQQTYDIQKVNLQTDAVDTLYSDDGADFTFPFGVYDSYSDSLYIEDTKPVTEIGSGILYQSRLRQFSLAENNYTTGTDHPIIDELPAWIIYGIGDNSVFVPQNPFVASISYTYNLPNTVDPVDPDDPVTDNPVINVEQPDITDITPNNQGPAAPAAPRSSLRAPSLITAPQNTLFALAKRIPEPIAIGFPWILLTLALFLVSIQYSQVRSEALATKRMQMVLKKQQRLVEEQNNFVALSTHYLHTPLTVMEGEISLMVKAGTLTQEQATKLKATLASLGAEAEAALAEEEQIDA
jgi:sugar lactone lactonase YvrE